jgi:4-amino-4-deoxy-L-arabinose transferase-like glycosyltransferase
VILLLILTALPLLWRLDGTGRLSTEELAAVSVADETFRRQQHLAQEGWTLDRWVPVRAATPVLDEPPGLAWMHDLSMMIGLGQAPSGPDLLERLRLVSVVMAMVAVGAVFWAGCSLGGPIVGLVAGLIFLANPLLLHAGREATATVPAAAWSLLAVAALLWAIRPNKAIPKLRRQVLGWVIGGITLGLAGLVQGPAVAMLAFVPLLVLVLAGPRRLTRLIGLGSAAAIAILIATPWAIYIHHHDPAAWSGWAQRLWPTGDDDVVTIATERALGLLVNSGIWIFLLIMAWFTLWVKRENRDAVSTKVFGLMTAAVLLFMLVLPRPGGNDWMAGVLLAQAMLALFAARQLLHAPGLEVAGRSPQTTTLSNDKSAPTHTPMLWLIARWPTALIVLVGSISAPLILDQPTHIAWSPLLYGLAVGVILILFAVAGFLVIRDRRCTRAVAAWSLWSLSAFSLLVLPWPAQDPQMVERISPTDRSAVPLQPTVNPDSQSGNRRLAS